MFRDQVKGFIAGALVTGLVVGGAMFAANYQAVTAGFQVFVDGQAVLSDPPALVVEGRTYLPLRAIGEALGVPVHWNEQLKQAEIGDMAKADRTDSRTEYYPDSNGMVANFGFIVERDADVIDRGEAGWVKYYYDIGDMTEGIRNHHADSFLLKLMRKGYVSSGMQGSARVYCSKDGALPAEVTISEIAGIYCISYQPAVQ